MPTGSSCEVGSGLGGGTKTNVSVGESTSQIESVLTGECGIDFVIESSRNQFGSRNISHCEDQSNRTVHRLNSRPGHKRPGWHGRLIREIRTGSKPATGAPAVAEPLKPAGEVDPEALVGASIRLIL